MNIDLAGGEGFPDLARALPVDIQNHVEAGRQLLLDGVTSGAVAVIKNLRVLKESIAFESVSRNVSSSTK